MPKPTRNDGADSRGLLINTQFPNNFGKRIAALEERSRFTSRGGVVGGGDPGAGFPPAVPLIATASVAYNTGAADVPILQIIVQFAYDPPGDFVALEVEVAGGSTETNQIDVVTLVQPYTDTWTGENLGMVLGGTYMVRVRALLSYSGPTGWSDWYTGLYYDINPLIPPAPTDLDLDTANPPYFGWNDKGAWETLRWTPTGAPAVRQALTYWQTSDPTGTMQPIQIPDATTDHYQLQGLLRDVEYSVNLVGINDPYVSPPATLTFTPPHAIPNPPTGLDLDEASVQTIAPGYAQALFTFAPGAEDATTGHVEQYIVELVPDAGGPTLKVLSTLTTVLISGILLGASYTATAYGGTKYDEWSGPSAAISVTLAHDDPAPPLLNVIDYDPGNNGMPGWISLSLTPDVGGTGTPDTYNLRADWVEASTGQTRKIHKNGVRASETSTVLSPLTAGPEYVISGWSVTKFGDVSQTPTVFDYVLNPAPAATLPNPDFEETSLADKTKPAKWSLWGDGNPSVTWALDSAEYRTGTRSLRLTREPGSVPGAGGLAYSAPLTFTPGKNVNIYFSAKKDDPSGGAKLFVSMWYYAAGVIDELTALGHTDVLYQPSDTAWHDTYVTIPASGIPAGTVQARVVLHPMLSTDTAHWWIDNVRLGPTLRTNDYDDDSVTTAKLAAGAVDATVLAAGAVGTTQLADGSVTTPKLALLAVDSTILADNSVIAAKIGTSAVTNTKIQNNAVNAAKINADAVTTVKILDGNVTTSKLADLGVTTAKLADANVTQAKLANNSVGAAQIINGSVGIDEMGANSVGTSQIIDGNVTQAKLAANSVGTSQILDANVTAPKLATGAIDAKGKFGSGMAAIQQGSINPVFPTTADRNWRSDSATYRDTFYDGTRWDSTDVKIVQFINSAWTTAVTVSNSNVGRMGIAGNFAWLPVRFFAAFFVGGTNNASSYWTLTLRYITAGNTATNLATMNTQAEIPNNWRPLFTETFLVATIPTTAFMLEIIATATGSPSGLLIVPSLAFREIIP